MLIRVTRTLQRLFLCLCLLAAPAFGCSTGYSWLLPTTWIARIQARFAVPKPPPPPLLEAGTKADARFLVQTKYGYDFNPAFVGPMTKAIEAAKSDISVGLAGTEPITVEQVYAWMDGIAKVRNGIEMAEGGGGDGTVGKPMPRSANELRSPGSGPRFDPTIVDYLSPDPDHFAFRHAPFFDAAVRTAKAQKPLLAKAATAKLQISAFGESFPATAIVGMDRVAIVIHPGARDSIPIHRRAVEEIAKALNDKTISETEFVDRLAQSYALLMTATPYHRGSPSIVESLYDAALRAKFGKTFGRKTEEPFWQVVLRTPAQEPFRGPDFLRCFGGEAIP